MTRMEKTRTFPEGGTPREGLGSGSDSERERLGWRETQMEIDSDGVTRIE